MLLQLTLNRRSAIARGIAEGELRWRAPADRAGARTRVASTPDGEQDPISSSSSGRATCSATEVDLREPMAA